MKLEHDRVTGRSRPAQGGWTGRWARDSLHLLDVETGIDSRDLVASEDLEALASLALTLHTTVDSGSWRELLSTALLSGHDDDTVSLEQREKLLSENLPSIARVTERFVTRLGERSELLPVARVKRPARRALDRLAAHTEDWAGRTLSGPVPRRALAVTRDEDANLYENRMVTELVHPILSSGLLARIRKLRRLVSDLADLDPAQHIGTYQRTERLYSFWGADALKASETQVHAEQTLAVLEKLSGWVQALRGSTLSVLLRGQTTGQRSLRQTNVISNDLHYRAAGEVWTAYQLPEVEVETPEEKAERLVARHQTFDVYVLGLVVRALDSLGYKTTAGELPAPGGTVELSGLWGIVSLSRASDGVLTLRCRGSSTRFVPLLDMVAPDDDHELMSKRWTDLATEVDQATVIVYLAAATSIRDLPNLELAAAMCSAMDDSQTPGPHLTGVPVSPLEITSLERIARAVGLVVRIPVLAAYPPLLRLGSEPMPVRLVDHLEAAGIADPNLSPLLHRTGNELSLRRSLTLGERTRLDNVVRSLTDAVRGTGWQRDYGHHISKILDSFERAAVLVDALLGCPVCSVRADTRRLQREGDIFTIECQSCGTRWGHERCGSCQHRIPIIEPAQELLNPEVKGPGWVERIFGQDALASQCWSRATANRYICPACRACPVAIEPAASACVRCR